MTAVLPAMSPGAERKSWNRVRYLGGTVAIQTSPYDWNTTLAVTASPASITVTIAPAKIFSAQRRVEIPPARVISLSEGAAAWRRVGEVDGSSVPPRPQSLFGLVQEYRFVGIVYETDQGKRGALLLECFFAAQIQNALARLTGKPIERAP